MTKPGGRRGTSNKNAEKGGGTHALVVNVITHCLFIRDFVLKNAFFSPATFQWGNSENSCPCVSHILPLVHIAHNYYRTVHTDSTLWNFLAFKMRKCFPTIFESLYLHITSDLIEQYLNNI